MHLVFSRSQAFEKTSNKITEYENFINLKLRNLVEHAKRSPFYRERLSRANISNVVNLSEIPTLTRAEMEAQMPLQSEGLATGKASGGYVPKRRFDRRS